jgi:hypothetical protein
VNTNATAPRYTDEGQRAASKIGGEQKAQVVDAAHVERRAHHEDPERVEDRDRRRGGGAAPSPTSSGATVPAPSAASACATIPRDPRGRSRCAERCEARRRHEQLRVRRLEQARSRARRSARDSIDRGRALGWIAAFEHRPAACREEAEHHERLGVGVTRDGRALLEHQRERQHRRRRSRRARARRRPPDRRGRSDPRAPRPGAGSRGARASDSSALSRGVGLSRGVRLHVDADA